MNIIKLDCERCEMGMSRDIFKGTIRSSCSSVDQISIETHVTMARINSTEDAYYFGLHFAFLEEAGFRSNTPASSGALEYGVLLCKDVLSNFFV